MEGLRVPFNTFEGIEFCLRFSYSVKIEIDMCADWSDAVT